MASYPLNDVPPSLQPLSPFFNRLPLEVRQLIYLEVWRTTSFRQHIASTKTSTVPSSENAGTDNAFLTTTRWHHVPCRTDPTAIDKRSDEFRRAARGSVEEAIWATRLKSEWCLHWACEESQEHWQKTPAGQRLLHYVDQQGGTSTDNVSGTASKTPFKSMLQVCKRMYLEALPSLYSNLTFVFTDLVEADEFLARYTSSPESQKRYPIRHLELCIRTTQLLTELYWEEVVGPNPAFGGTSGESSHPGISSSNNPWQRVCDHLCQFTNLTSLRIWFDTRDLRGWHTVVSEDRVFAKLLGVKAVKDRKNFVLALPEIPSAAIALSMEAHYLEEDTLLRENAPFSLERGPRPNNWRVHLMTSGLRGS